MKALNDLKIFVETARQGSFSRVAHSMNLTPAAVSASIKRMEQQLGFALFVRSTRSLRLTNEGEVMLDSASQALETLQEGIDQIHQQRGELAGQIYLSAPSDFGRNLLLDWIGEFMASHRNVTIKLSLSDSLTDLYSQPVDIAIRYGQPADSRLIAMPLCLNNRRILCASPEYLAAQPGIHHPDHLRQHNCLCFMLADTLHNKWPLSLGSEMVTVTVEGSPSCNDGDLVRKLALQGKGIANKSQLDVGEDLLAGRLVQVLPDWLGELAPLYMVYPDRRLISPTIRAFQTFLQQQCQQHQQRILASTSNQDTNR
ncbi:LysR family transcriptional regulator [Vibrio sp.]|uniref:LysR family transcriptional regulator n=1 Tax=Vibrio sp. TaxID=678 RepID=UPI003D0A917E